MEKFEMNELDNCFVCGEYMGTFKNELQVNTAYSERTVLEIIEKFIESRVTEVVANNGGICQNCFIKFNEYDEYLSKAEAIQSEISNMMHSNLTYIEFKDEPEDKIDQIIYTEYDENMVEVMPEQFADSYTITEEHTVKSSPPSISQKSPAKVKRLSTPKTAEKQRTYNSKSDKDEGYIITLIDGVKNYTCETCSKNFISRSRLRTHHLIHSTTRNFRCIECGADFKTMNCLKNHSRLHMNIFFYCDLCENKFKGKHELRCHIEAVHLKRKDHVCPICGKAFSRDKTLRQHLVYHLNERNIVCEICGFKTINRSKMNRHLKSHSGSRDYSCNICGKKFLYSYNVSAHIKHVHYHEKRPQTNESKLTCNVCGKKFQKIWKVTAHMRDEHNIIEEYKWMKGEAI